VEVFCDGEIGEITSLLSPYKKTRQNQLKQIKTIGGATPLLAAKILGRQQIFTQTLT
jgi:hypothetical protein